MKGTLAYSSISQIGFVLFGIAITALLGEDGAIAAYGTLFHMLNHTFIKFLLFSIAGVVFQSTKTTDLNQLRGWGKEKPLFHLLFVIGGGSMAGIPLLSGYISKTLLHESVVEYIHLANASLLFSVAEYLFLLAGGCTLAYMLKLYLCLFWDGTSPSSTPHCATTKTKVVLSLVALALVVLGTVPHLTFDLIGATNASFMGVEPLHTVAYFSLTNLLGAATSLIIGLFLFWCVRSRALHLNSPHYSGRTDRLPTLYHLLYRPLATALSFSAAIVARIFDLSTDVAVTIISRTLFTPLSIPDAFYEGDPTYGRHQRTRIHITYSLAYSLLMFGVGFLFTLAMLLYLVLSR